jgi:hypothetical protein
MVRLEVDVVNEMNTTSGRSVLRFDSIRFIPNPSVYSSFAEHDKRDTVVRGNTRYVPATYDYPNPYPSHASGGVRGPSSCPPPRPVRDALSGSYVPLATRPDGG